MRKIIHLCCALILFTIPTSLLAQQAAEEPANKPTAKHFYQLLFSVQEIGENGKVSNSRSYTTTIATGPNSWQPVSGPYVSIRTGDKVPVKTGDDDGKGEKLQYIDLGVNFDCDVAQEIYGKLALQVNAMISSAVKASDPTFPPVIRQNKWSSNVLVPIAKPTVIFSSDNLQDKGKLQVEVTATRIE